MTNLAPEGQTPDVTVTTHIVLPKPTISMTVRQRINMGIPHLLSAAQFSRATKQLETLHAGQEFGHFWDEILAQATATVFTAVAGVEAYANELFADRASTFPNVRADVLKPLWDAYERKPLLEKYELALVLRESAAIDRKGQIYQDAELLIRLRNALVHFKPEWTDERVKHEHLSIELGKRVIASPFTPAAPLFPMAWAGHSCTSWAVKCAVALILEFQRLAGLAGRIEPFLDRLENH